VRPIPTPFLLEISLVSGVAVTGKVETLWETLQPMKTAPFMLRKKIANILVVSLILVSFSGCVQRRLVVRSHPEGALVTIDRQRIGLTPLSVPYTYSGTREVQLEKDGYKTVKVQQRVDPTWYEKFPVSFVTENFWPRELRDERLLEFQLEPKTQVQENLLLDRANDLRGNVQRGTVTAPIH
jgi:hypothetical protein